MAESNGLMRFVVSMKHAAEHNSEEAKLRECTRIAMIAHGLKQLGHAVVFNDVHSLLLNSDRWEYFKHIPVDPEVGGKTVHASRRGASTAHADVIISGSVRPKDELMVSKLCFVYVCHERYSHIENAVDIPFFVHDRFITDLAKKDLLREYLTDDIDSIRGQFSYTKNRDVGFMGCGGWHERKGFFNKSPEWVEAKFYDTHPLSAWDHAQWLCGCKAGVSLSGDTPKTNLPPLLALLGIPIISPVIERNTPPLDEDSMILFEDWNQVKSVVEDDEKLSQITKNATEIYKQGWSPLGVAKQIMERIRTK